MALSNISKTINYNAQSIVDDNVIAYMNATITTNGEITKSYNINDKTLYKQNLTEVENDWSDFSNEVNQLADLV